MVPKFCGIACFILDVKQGLQPLRTQAFSAFMYGVTGLVHPVCCNPRLCDHVHGVSAQLELDVDACRTHKSGVQRLIAIDLGDGDMVFEFAWHRFIELVQDA